MATHQTNLQLIPSVPPELEVGANVTLKVKVSCPEGCDLRGIPVRVMAPREGDDEVVITTELVTHDEKIDETEDFVRG